MRLDEEPAGVGASPTGEGEHIFPIAIAQKFVVGPDGGLGPLTTGSTRGRVDRDARGDREGEAVQLSHRV